MCIQARFHLKSEIRQDYAVAHVLPETHTQALGFVIIQEFNSGVSLRRLHLISCSCISELICYMHLLSDLYVNSSEMIYKSLK